MKEINEWYLNLKDSEKCEILEWAYDPGDIIGDIDELFLLLDNDTKMQIYEENKDVY